MDEPLPPCRGAHCIQCAFPIGAVCRSATFLRSGDAALVALDRTVATGEFTVNRRSSKCSVSGLGLKKGVLLSVAKEVRSVLGRVLRLEDKARHFEASTALFGAIAEFDSRAGVTLVAALEDEFGIVF